MIEFAISASLLISIFMGVFQFGYAMYIYNELVGAVRGGVRYASLANLSNSGDGSIPSAFSTGVKNMVVYGTPAPVDGQSTLVNGLSTGNVSVGVTFDAKKTPTNVTVSITGFTIDAVLKSFTLSQKPVMSMPYFGKYCPAGTSC